MLRVDWHSMDVNKMLVILFTWNLLFSIQLVEC